MFFIGHSYRGYLMPTSVHTVITDSKTCVVGYTSGSLAQYDFHGEQLLQLLRPTDVESYARDSRDFQINQVSIEALVKWFRLFLDSYAYNNFHLCRSSRIRPCRWQLLLTMIARSDCMICAQVYFFLLGHALENLC